VLGQAAAHGLETDGHEAIVRRELDMLQVYRRWELVRMDAILYERSHWDSKQNEKGEYLLSNGNHVS